MAVDYAALKKGGFMRQKQKNNFSLRLRVVGGNVTAEQLAKIAEVAKKYGDGHVHLTSRQSIEIPFVKLDDIVSFGGLFGNQISKGEPVIPFIDDHDKLMAVCDAAIEFFKDNANPSERFKFTIDRVGAEKFRRAVLNAYDSEGEL